MSIYSVIAAEQKRAAQLILIDELRRVEAMITKVNPKLGKKISILLLKLRLNFPNKESSKIETVISPKSLCQMQALAQCQN